MEELLNKLIEKGREPFGNYRDIITRYKYDNRFFEFNHEGDNMVSIRELVSIDSGLWQFVCENGMANNVGNFVYRRLRDGKRFGLDKPITHFTYRIIESALCDEDKLEQFLINNIKI